MIHSLTIETLMIHKNTPFRFNKCNNLKHTRKDYKIVFLNIFKDINNYIILQLVLIT